MEFFFFFFIIIFKTTVFPENERERKESLRQPTRYYAFPEDFKQLILQKEKDGLLCWLKPDQDYHKVSAFFEQIVDPVTGQRYAPLILDDQWWRHIYDRTKPRSSSSSSSSSSCIRPQALGPDAFQVIHNYKLGDHDYQSTMVRFKNLTIYECTSAHSSCASHLIS